MGKTIPTDKIDSCALELLAPNPLEELAANSLDGYIGVFDSGVGGISVLRELTSLMPHENFVFFGDSANAPYGDKPYNTVFELSSRIARAFIDRGCKAIVIACNTATSTAADRLRAAYPQVPIIGIEPALKPAATSQHSGSILVMATEVTLALDKFRRLLIEYGGQSKVALVPCVGLADRIEKGNLEDRDLYELIDSLVGKYRGQVESVVLGCTHYLFVKKQIQQVLGNVNFFDGNTGTALQLKHVLEQTNLASTNGNGQVLFYSSLDNLEEIELYKRFYKM